MAFWALLCLEYIIDAIFPLILGIIIAYYVFYIYHNLFYSFFVFVTSTTLMYYLLSNYNKDILKCKNSLKEQTFNSTTNDLNRQSQD